MFADPLSTAHEARLHLRGWWARERPTGVALFLFAVRWVAWSVAAIIVVLKIVPEANVQREPALILGTMLQCVVLTLYLPVLRPQVRERLKRLPGRSINDVLLVGLLDLAVSLGILYLSGGWNSPYYLFAVAALLVPCATLGLRSNLLLALCFGGAYTFILATAGAGTSGPWHGAELNNFAVFLTIPFIVAVVIQFFGWMSRQLAQQREAADAALTENVRLQQEREALAAAQERSRIAREIHDGVAQSIYMLSLNLEAAADTAGSQPEVSDRLQSLVGLAKQTLMEVRHYIFDLKPLLDGQTGVAAALKNQAREFTAVAGLPVVVEVTGDERELPAAKSAAIYRITQEALSNVYRHAHASQVTVRLEFAENRVLLEVRDDGAGLNGAAPGRGLRNMHQRAADIWGTFTIESAPRRGTVVRVALPAEDT